MRVDFHIHTTASDGQYSPTEVVKMAKNNDLKCIAITDHDTINGLEEAYEAGKQNRIRVLGGVEFGAEEHRYLHILGLDIDRSSPDLQKLCWELEKSRNERKYRIIEYLKEKDIVVSLDEVEEIAGGNIIARPHFAQVLVNKGYVKTTREAFDKYLDTEEYQRIERKKAKVKECIEAIHKAKGKAVLAHPYQLKFEDAQLDELVKELVSYGLDGIECYYPLHSEIQTEYYLKLARKYNLIISAGSDFHGEKVKPDIKLANRDINIDWI
jgi:hypothetical protein